MEPAIMGEFKLTTNIKLVPIAGEIADEMGRRLSALKGAVECIRRDLLGATDGAAADALYGVAHEIERIARDLDAHAWENRDNQVQGIDAAND